MNSLDSVETSVKLPQSEQQWHNSPVYDGAGNAWETPSSLIYSSLAIPIREGEEICKLCLIFMKKPSYLAVNKPKRFFLVLFYRTSLTNTDTENDTRKS